MSATTTSAGGPVFRVLLIATSRPLCVGDSHRGAAKDVQVTGNTPTASESSGQSGYLLDDAVVVRGGQMRAKDLMTSAETYEAEHPGEYGLSFWSWPGLTAEEIAQRVGTKRLPHPVLRKCTVGKIQSMIPSDQRPLTLVKTFGPGHYTLFLPSPPTDDDYKDLSELFDPPQQNPVAKSVAVKRSE